MPRFHAWLVTPPPALHLDHEGRVLFGGAALVLSLGVVAYLGFAPAFALFGLPQMVVVNTLIALGLAAGVALLRRGWLVAGVEFGVAAVVAHGWLATWLVGWGGGFHYQILIGLLMQGLAVPASRRGRAAGTALVALAYVGLAAVGPTFPGAAGLDPWKVHVFATMNVLTCVGVMAVAAALYGGGIQQARRERDAAEQRLREALRESRAVVDNMAEGLVALDGAGRLRSGNRSFAALVGAEALDDAHVPEALRVLAAQATAAGEPRVGEVALPGGRLAVAIASGLGELGGAVVLVRDVTKERAVDRMKTEFTAVVSHELRTPLTSVLGFTRMIQGRLDQRILPHTDLSDPRTERAVAQVRENLAIILEEGRRLSTLIGDVLDIAKMEAGSMQYAAEPVDVAELVRAAVAAASGLFGEGPVQLVVDVQPGLPPVVGDRDRLLQVLVNLVSNAAKFTTEGEVRIEARRSAGVRLVVRDTGRGIPESEREAVFDRYHQVSGGDRPRGTGLGLPICRHIVEAHGGTIVVAPSEGPGAAIVVELPVEAAPGGDEAAEAP